MKRHFSNLLTISLTTSLLLASAQKAFGHSVETQANIKEAKPLVHNVESLRGNVREWTHNQGMLDQEQATKQTIQSSQTSLTGESIQVSDTFQALFAIFLFSGYILGGLGYRKYRARKATTLSQQIAMLERIWRMKSHQ